MEGRVRVSQVYELQRVALINVHYYARRATIYTRVNRGIQIAAAVTASGTIVSAFQMVPAKFLWLSVAISAIAAGTSAAVVIFNITETIARLERMHAAYKLLYHSAETLAKQVIGSDHLTPEQDATASILEFQLAALGPQDEIDPSEKRMKAAQERAQKQLPEAYYYPKNAT